jgi:hypothetical protein
MQRHGVPDGDLIRRYARGQGRADPSNAPYAQWQFRRMKSDADYDYVEEVPIVSRSRSSSSASSSASTPDRDGCLVRPESTISC